MREALSARARRARDLAPEQFAEWSEAETRAARRTPTTAEALIQAAPPDQLGMGLRRYWEARACVRSA